MRHIGILVFLLTATSARGLAAGTPPPSLVGRYDGTYTIDGTTSAQTLQIEVEAQHGRRLRVSLFAMNQPEYMGHGHISADATSIKLGLHATGRRRLVLSGSLLDGGATFEGTFVSKRPGHPSGAGTFAVGR